MGNFEPEWRPSQAKPLMDRAFSGCASSPECCCFRSQLLLCSWGILDGRLGIHLAVGVVLAFSRAITPEGRLPDDEEVRKHDSGPLINADERG